MVGRQLTSAAPECEPPVWKIYDAVSKTDGKVENFSFQNLASFQTRCAETKKCFGKCRK